MRRHHFGRLMALAGMAVYVLGTLIGTAGPAMADGVEVSGGGSTFAQPEYQQWTATESNAPANLNVQYSDPGSSAGRDDYATGTYQYGASDIIYYSVDGDNATEAATQHPYTYVTVSAGGLAFMYNIVVGGQQWTGLNLTQQDVCQIFDGQLNNWSQLASTQGDSILAAVNEPITAFHRSDSAGESYVLSQYCIAVDPGDWGSFVGYVGGNDLNEGSGGWPGDSDMSVNKPIENWPPILEGNVSSPGASGASVMASDISSPNSGQYSIGYMATAYAVQAGLPVASVQNANPGDFVQPNATSVNAALAYAQPNSEGTFDLQFTGPNPAAYFPSTYSYAIAPTSTNAPASAAVDATLSSFLCYAIGQGQGNVGLLKYAPLSAEVTALSVSAIEQIPGAPPNAQCGTGGPAPVIAVPQGVAPVTIPPPSGSAGGSGSGGGGTPGSTGPTGSSSGTPASGAAPGADAGSPTGTAAGGGAGSGAAGGGSGAAAGAATTTTLAGATTKGGSASSTAAGSPTDTAAGGSTAGSGSSAAGVGAGQAGSQGATGGAGGSSEEADTPVSVAELASAGGANQTTNSEAYWYLLLGAAVCAMGVGAVGAKRRIVR
jgi:ABC-type phosphate transport system substrate-binding protein